MSSLFFMQNLYLLRRSKAMRQNPGFFWLLQHSLICRIQRLTTQSIKPEYSLTASLNLIAISLCDTNPAEVAGFLLVLAAFAELAELNSIMQIQRFLHF